MLANNSKTKYKVIICWLLLVAFSSCMSLRQKLEAGKQMKIIPSRGFDTFCVRATTKTEVIQKLGNDFTDTPFLSPSWELKYKSLGLSFIYYRSNDTIWDIIFYSPFNGITDKGIVLNKSTMEDVEITYGKLKWQISTPFTHWASVYPGIEYQVETNPFAKTFPLDTAKHIHRIVTRIEVLNNEHIYKDKSLK